MSFLIDPILLVLCGVIEVDLYAKVLQKRFKF